MIICSTEYCQKIKGPYIKVGIHVKDFPHCHRTYEWTRASRRYLKLLFPTSRPIFNRIISYIIEMVDLFKIWIVFTTSSINMTITSRSARITKPHRYLFITNNFPTYRGHRREIILVGRWHFTMIPKKSWQVKKQRGNCCRLNVVFDIFMSTSSNRFFDHPLRLYTWIFG